MNKLNTAANLANLVTPAVLVLSAGLFACQADHASAKKTRPDLSVAKSVPAASPARAVAASPTIEQFMKIRTPGSCSIDPQGRMYVRDWPDGIWQLYRVTPGADGSYDLAKAKVEKLTSYTDGLGGYSFSPDNSRIILSHAVGGNENTQLTLLDPATGQTSPVLANPKVQSAINTWLEDSSGFIYSANDTNPNDFHLYRWDFAADGGKGAATKILGKEGSWSAGDASKDASRFIVAKFNSASDSSVYELNAASGELREITLRQGEGMSASNDVVGYMPGDQAVLLLSDYQEGANRLYMRSLEDGSVSSPIPALDRYEIDGAGFNLEKTMLAVVTNEDGYAVPHIYRVPGFEPVKLPEMEKGVIGLSDFRGSRLIWSLNNARTPGLAYATDLESGKTTQLTWADTAGVDLSAFALPELVKYKSFDGLEIPAFVYRPANAKGAIPFVANYHGGPEGQFRPVFDRTTQYLVSRGYGVIQPNVRGSTGYGRAFQMMDDYKNRYKSVADGVAAAAYLVEKGYSRPGMIATYGGSYGGFMSVACLVADQERVESGEQKQRLFGAGINVVGIVNLKTFLEQTSGYRRRLREAEYGPLTDSEFLDSISSIRKIDKINVPMFIAHGLNDPRVPVGEAMQLAVGLQKRGFDPELFFAPDEGHGFAKLENRLIFAKQMARFLDKTIGAEGAGAAGVIGSEAR